MAESLQLVPPPPAGRARADFVCNSAKCRQEDGSAPVYELPVTAVRCPCCGSKRVRRLYNAVNVSRPGFYKVNREVDKVLADVGEQYHQQRDSRLQGLKRGTPALAVPIKQLEGVLGSFGLAAPDITTGSRPIAGPAHPVLAPLANRTPVPGPDSRIDRESKLPV